MANASKNNLKGPPKEGMIDSQEVIVAEGDRWTPAPRPQASDTRIEIVEEPPQYESAAQVVDETRIEMNRFVARNTARQSSRRKRINWKAYRGPAVPRKLLLGLRRKQSERERKAREYARATGML